MNLPDPLVVVPARGGSKRLSRKNVRRLGELSLIGWTMATARAAGLSQVLLSTDDDEIAAEGSALGYWQPFRRPSELAQDDVTTLAGVLNLLDWCRDTFHREPELVMLLQPTSPFRTVTLINEARLRLIQHPASEAVISVKRLHVPLGQVCTDVEGMLDHVSRTGDVRPAYAPSGALYLNRSSALRIHSTFLPPSCMWIAHDGLSTLDIDTPDDWAIAEAMVASGRARPSFDMESKEP